MEPTLLPRDMRRLYRFYQQRTAAHGAGATGTVQFLASLVVQFRLCYVENLS